jgi:high-affinity iron transporter
MFDIGLDWITVTFIVFREALEAGLVSLIMLAYLIRLNRRDLIKYVYIGVGSAVVLSLILGVSILLIYSELSDIGADFFEIVAGFIAVPILTFMIMWMARASKRIRGELEERIQFFIDRNYLIGIVIVSLTTVAREGLETVLFLMAFIVSAPLSTIIGSIIGIIITLGLLWTINKGFMKIKLQSIFKYTSLIIIILAAGILFKTTNKMVNFLADIGISLGVWGHPAYYMNIPDNSLFSDEGLIGGIISAFTGYMPQATWLAVITYILYWSIAGFFFYKTYAD